MGLRACFAVAIVGAVLALGALAFATPPDPTWIGGFYDNADFDDVVLLITENGFGVSPVIVSDAAPSCIAIAPAPELDAPHVPASPTRENATRAPPVV